MGTCACTVQVQVHVHCCVHVSHLLYWDRRQCPDYRNVFTCITHTLIHMCTRVAIDNVLIFPKNILNSSRLFLPLKY